MSPSVNNSNTIQGMAKTGTLDRIDFDIIAALRKNARIPNNKLAQKVGIAPSTCLERVRRLVATGAVKGFYAEIDPDTVGIGLQAMITVQLPPLIRCSTSLVEYAAPMRTVCTPASTTVKLFDVSFARRFPPR